MAGRRRRGGRGAAAESPDESESGGAGRGRKKAESFPTIFPFTYIPTDRSQIYPYSLTRSSNQTQICRNRPPQPNTHILSRGGVHVATATTLSTEQQPRYAIEERALPAALQAPRHSTPVVSPQASQRQAHGHNFGYCRQLCTRPSNSGRVSNRTTSEQTLPKHRVCVWIRAQRPR